MNGRWFLCDLLWEIVYRALHILCLLLQVLFTQLILPICWAFGNYTLVTECKGTLGKGGSVLQAQLSLRTFLGAYFPSV